MIKLSAAVLILVSSTAFAAKEMTVCPPPPQAPQAEVPGLRSISTPVKCQDAHMSVMGNKCFKITALHGQVPVAQEEKPDYHEPAEKGLPQLVPR